MDIGEKNPPFDLDVERSLLASIILYGDSAIELSDAIEIDDFYTTAHKTIFEACKNIIASGNQIDIMSIADKITRSGNMEMIGGVAYLSFLCDVTTRINNTFLVLKLKNLSRKRKLLNIAQTINENIFDPDCDAEEIAELANKQISDIFSEQTERPYEKFSDIIPSAMNDMARAMSGQSIGISTGIKTLDNQSGGLFPGELTILAGRPSMGKTALALCIMNHFAVNLEKTCLFFSLETGSGSIVQRIISTQSRANLHLIRTGRFPHADFASVEDTAERIKSAPIYICDRSRITPMKVRTIAMRLRSTVGIDLIVIDNLGIMAPNQKEPSRNLEIGSISRDLLILTKELKIPVVVICQLSRRVESNGAGDKRPALSDLRDSGEIEQNADCVLFVYREAYYKRDDLSLQGRAEIIIAKQKNGPVGKINVAYCEKTMLWSDIEETKNYEGGWQCD